MNKPSFMSTQKQYPLSRNAKSIDVSEERAASIFNTKEKAKYCKRVCCLAYFSTVKIEAICSSETSKHVYMRCIPADRTLHIHRCDNPNTRLFKFSKLICHFCCVFGFASATNEHQGLCTSCYIIFDYLFVFHKTTLSVASATQRRTGRDFKGSDSIEI
jgi:hypothetical protein